MSTSHAAFDTGITFTPEGPVLRLIEQHTDPARRASAPAEVAAARAGVRDAAVRLLRSRDDRTPPRAAATAFAAWRALVSGRCSLVDHFDSDGARVLVAHRNDPPPPAAPELTVRELQITGHASLGHSNKLIAYDLSLSPTTVATHLSRARAKLGARSRVELIAAYECCAGRAPVAPIPTGLRCAPLVVSDQIYLVLAFPLALDEGRGLPTLTIAEEAVAAAATAGLTNAEIAAERGVAARTVANQLGSIYRKLRIGSRAELAACWYGRGAID